MIQLPPVETLSAKERFKIMRESKLGHAVPAELFVRYCVDCEKETWWHYNFGHRKEKGRPPQCLQCNGYAQPPKDARCYRCGERLGDPKRNTTGLCQRCWRNRRIL